MLLICCNRMQCFDPLLCLSFTYLCVMQRRRACELCAFIVHNLLTKTLMHARTAVKWAVTAEARQPVKPSVSVLNYGEVNCSSFIDLQFIPRLAVPPIPFYLTIFSILTPVGAHRSQPEKANGDFWKGAPAVNKREC